MNNLADRLGGSLLRLLGEIDQVYRRSLAILLCGLRMHWLTSPAVMHVVYRQIYFTGVQGLFWVALVAFGIGIISIYNIVDFSRGIQDPSLIGQLISSLLVEEVAPLLVTILLLSRSGVAVVTELGTMHVRGEDLTLRSLGISIEEYLLWPRMLAFTLCGLILTVVFALVAIVCGGLVVVTVYDMNFIDYLFEVHRGTSFEEILMLLGKGAGFAMLSAAVLLSKGCRGGSEPNLIPVLATQGVLGSLILVILADAMIALITELL